jgi:FtsP/CotA-like multicopper oxidase with cupredoxin domain
VNVLQLTRRSLLLGAGASALLARTRIARAAAPRRFTAEKRVLEVAGKAAPVLGLSTGAPVAHFAKGDAFLVTLDNGLGEPTLIHWHGLQPPSAQDGMPGLSQPPLPPGKSYDYDFPLNRSGTFWMHSHVGFQRSKLLAAPLIISDPADKGRDEQEVVVFLIDFSFRAPEAIFADLTGGKGAMPGMDHGAMAGMDHGSMPGMGGGMAMDINDIDFDAYLANDRSLDDPAIERVAPGGKVRLRIINGSSATNFWIDLGALSGELIAVDGDPIVARQGRRFPIAMAQRLDIRLALPGGEGAYPILALREGAAERTGIVLATKSARVSKLAVKADAATKPLGTAFEETLTAAQPLTARKPDRTLVANLTGDMERFQWSINGKPFGEDTPFRVRRGERVALVMRNRTGMSHPMHLHGHDFQVVEIGARRLSGARRDTVLVPAMGTVTVVFDAVNPGKWAFHCHNEYHMMAGMMTSVQYEA